MSIVVLMKRSIVIFFCVDTNSLNLCGLCYDLLYKWENAPSIMDNNSMMNHCGDNGKFLKSCLKVVGDLRKWGKCLVAILIRENRIGDTFANPTRNQWYQVG